MLIDSFYLTLVETSFFVCWLGPLSEHRLRRFRQQENNKARSLISNAATNPNPTQTHSDQFNYSNIIQYVAAVVLVLVTYTNATKASLSKTDVSNHKVTYNLSIQKMREGMRKPYYLAESDIFHFCVIQTDKHGESRDGHAARLSFVEIRAFQRNCFNMFSYVSSRIGPTLRKWLVATHPLKGSTRTRFLN